MKCFPFIFLFLLTGMPLVSAQDPGTESIGKMSVELIYATNGTAEDAGAGAKPLDESDVKILQGVEELKFAQYRLLGSDVPDILKGYESWATPLRPSKEILVSFQPIKRDEADKMQIVLEYWQGKRKIFSTNPTLTKGKSFYLVGPKWRDGLVIISLKILSLEK